MKTGNDMNTKGTERITITRLHRIVKRQINKRVNICQSSLTTKYNICVTSYQKRDFKHVNIKKSTLIGQLKNSVLKCTSQ